VFGFTPFYGGVSLVQVFIKGEFILTKKGSETPRSVGCYVTDYYRDLALKRCLVVGESVYGVPWQL
jgi:hypothetical protein